MNEKRILEANLQCLSASQPDMARRIRDINPEQVSVFPSKRGELTLQVDGLMVHSRYDPRAEAVRLTGRDPQYLHLHFGFGLGYFAEQDEVKPSGAMLVLEPDLRILAAAFGCRSLAELFVAKAVYFAVTLEQMEDLLIQHLVVDEPVRQVVTPYHRQRHPQTCQALNSMLDKLRTYQAMSARSLANLGTPVIHASFRSLPFTSMAPDFSRLLGRLRGMPAVVIAAGPSLERNLPQLLPFRDKVVVVAISRVARLLERFGIEPDFLVHLEAQDFFGFIRGCLNLSRTTFLLPEQCDDRFFEFPHRHTFVYNTPLNFVSQWFHKHVPAMRRYVLSTGGSVATDAFSLAAHMGCNPLVLMGQDLALDGQRIYACGDINPNFGYESKHEREVKGYFGNRVPTLSHYLHFIYWYEDFLQELRQEHGDLAAINATEGGAHIEGFSPRKLRDIATQHFTQPLDLSSRLTQAADPAERSTVPHRELAAFLRPYQRRVDSIQALSKNFYEVSSKMRQNLKDPSRPFRLIQKGLTKLEQMQAKLHALLVDFEVLSGLFQKELQEADRLQRQRQRDRRADQVTTDEWSDMKRDLLHDLDSMTVTFDGIQRAAGLLKPMLEETITRLDPPA